MTMAGYDVGVHKMLLEHPAICNIWVFAVTILLAFWVCSAIADLFNGPPKY